MSPDKIDIQDEDGEVVIRIDTSGVGRAIADSLVYHAKILDNGGKPSFWRQGEEK